jgi:general L-amino acid transport system permease protein
MTSVTPFVFISAPRSRRSGAGRLDEENFFSDWFNSILTLIIVTVLGWGAFRLLTWAFTTAQWEVIPNNLGLFMTGTYPSELYARIWICWPSCVPWRGFPGELSPATFYAV